MTDPLDAIQVRLEKPYENYKAAPLPIIVHDLQYLLSRLAAAEAVCEASLAAFHMNTDEAISLLKDTLTTWQQIIR